MALDHRTRRGEIALGDSLAVYTQSLAIVTHARIVYAAISQYVSDFQAPSLSGTRTIPAIADDPPTSRRWI